MEESKRNRKVLKWFIGFLIFMIGITYISHTINVWNMPRVSLGFPEKDTFSRAYEMWGEVILTEEYPGYEAAAVFLMPSDTLPKATGRVALAGDQIYVHIKHIYGAAFLGEVMSLEITEEGMWMTAAFNLIPMNPEFNPDLDSIKGGETILGLYNRDYAYDAVVPASAVYKEGTNYYVMVVTAEEGPWGRVYVASKRGLTILDEMNGMMAIGVTIEEPIIFYTDSMVNHGDYVRFYP